MVALFKLANVYQAAETYSIGDTGFVVMLDAVEDELKLPLARVTFVCEQGRIFFDCIQGYITFARCKRDILPALKRGEQGLCKRFSFSNYDYYLRACDKEVYLWQKNIVDETAKHFMIPEKVIKVLFDMTYDVNEHFMKILMIRMQMEKCL